ncbi:MAG TPA: NAD(P)/FAD-dependent oxidoreductase [Enhygromyxa sp.]|nr:NAD(P)/FAD-dependent oxidoreductase [Enhygromyxa sp.]
MTEATHDVIVIGGGPAGSCASNLLAQAGVDTVVLEREHFPRFHIGESLLPFELGVLGRLGVNLDEGPFLRKRGAVFIDERTGRRTLFSFDEGLPGTPTHAHQVERSKFDHTLLLAARRAGADVREGFEVTAFDIDEDRVEVEVCERESGATSRLRARYLVDATGQQALLARTGKTVEPFREFGRAAVFRHFHGLAPAIVEELHERGDIIVKLIEDGWMWLIPLASGDLSVGLVKAKGKVEPALLDREIEESPLIQRLTAGAQASAPTMIGNYSYKNTRPYGQRFACIGDACAFLDPVFSSGVSLALAGGERLADILAPALAESREQDPELMKALGSHMAVAYEAFSRFIQRFYNTGLIDNVLLAEQHPSQTFRSGVISVLAADVWRDDNPFQQMLMAARRPI